MWACSSYPVCPANEKAKARLAAEEGWLKLGHDLGISTQIFRLGGIYGPGRRLLFWAWTNKKLLSCYDLSLNIFVFIVPFFGIFALLDKSRVWQILYRTKFRFTCAFCSSFLGVENLSFWPRASGAMEPITDLDLLHFKVDFLANYLYPSAVDTLIKQEPLSELQKMRASRQYTSRVHVADICQALRASICNPSSG